MESTVIRRDILASGLVDDDSFSHQPKKLRQYYTKRNQHIRDLLNIQNKTLEKVPPTQGHIVAWVVKCCVAVNILLCVAKIQVFVSTGSLAVLVSIVDSVLDLVSGGILWITVREISRATRDLYRFPIGKSRLELIGTLVFAIVMTFSMVVVGIESFKVLLLGLLDTSSGVRKGPLFGVVDFVVMSFTVGIKALLYVLFRHLNRESPVIEACIADQRNDAVMNLGGLAGGVLAGQFSSALWWADPLTALVLAGGVSVAWIGEAKTKIHLLTGVAASPSALRKITLMTYNHDQRIIKVDTVRAYHVGVKLFVEIHIVMDPQTPLRDSHDVGETLEHQIEQYFHTEVERAFVHMDYEWDHSPSSEHRASLREVEPSPSGLRFAVV